MLADGGTSDGSLFKSGDGPCRDFCGSLRQQINRGRMLTATCAPIWLPWGACATTVVCQIMSGRVKMIPVPRLTVSVYACCMHRHGRICSDLL